MDPSLLIIINLFALVITVLLISKIFQMSNNVQEIRRKFLPDRTLGDTYNKFLFYLSSGDKEAARRVVFISIWVSQKMRFLKESKSLSDFNKYHSQLKEEYQKYFDLLEDDFPSFDTIIKANKINR